jgi:hypothetical protein
MVESRDGIEEQTGTGAPRSSEGTVRTPSVERDGVPDLNINRSGSGGTGGPDTPDEADGADDETMEEMLGE